MAPTPSGGHLRFLLRPVSNAEIAILLGLLLSGLVYCGIGRVTVRNSSAVTLTEVSLTGNGFARYIDALPPHSSRTFWFVPSGDTSIRLAYRAQNRQVDVGQHGYYTAPPRPQLPGTLTVDARHRAHFRHARLPLFP